MRAPVAPAVPDQPDRPDALRALVRENIAAGLFHGAEWLVARGPEVLDHRALGTFDGARPLERGAVFDVASLTKPVATASLLMSLDLPLDSPVARYLPGFAGGGRDAVTLRQLAAHISGLPASRRLVESCATPAEARAALLAVPLDHPPGETVVYSCLGYMLLGLVIEAAAGEPLDALFAGRVAVPAGMADSGYLPLERGVDPARIVPAGTRPHNRGRPGVVNDSNAWVLGGVSGNAGLFSTAADLHRFARMLLRPAPPFSVHPMFAPQTPPGQPARSIGFEVNAPENAPENAPPQAASCGPGFPDGAVGHTGFTGTSLWIDPRDGLIVIVLTNRSAITHRGNLAPMAAFRRAFHRLAARLARQRPG